MLTFFGGKPHINHEEKVVFKYNMVLIILLNFYEVKAELQIFIDGYQGTIWGD